MNVRRGRATIASRCRLAFLPLFFLGSGLARIGSAQVTTAFPLPRPNTVPRGIASGPDGNVWFTEVTQGTGPIAYPVSGAVARIGPSGAITEFPLAGDFPDAIVPGPDGNMWLAVSIGYGFSRRLDRVTPAGVVSNFGVPVGQQPVSGLTAGPDGNLWFGAELAQIGRMTMNGIVGTFHLPDANSLVEWITSGPDGNLWFTEIQDNQIGRITPTGSLTLFPIPTPDSYPLVITTGPDGNLWFTEWVGNKIGRITTSGLITEYPVPTAGSEPAGLVASGGDLWFTEELGNKIGRITTDGTMTEFPLPTTGSLPTQIVATNDGTLWFVENTGIGRFTPFQAPACQPDTHTLCLNGGRFAVSASFAVAPEGPSTPAAAVPLTADSGYFWFFSPSNVEVVAKVLAGCVVNGNYWFFAGGLTNVRVDLLATDTVLGTSKTYSNPIGTPFQPIQDTAAFACP